MTDVYEDRGMDKEEALDAIGVLAAEAYENGQKHGGKHLMWLADTLERLSAYIKDPGYVRVPVEPTEAMWAGLARDIIMWMDMAGRPTGESLFDHLECCGRDIPQWLRDEVANDNHVPPKGTRAAIIYKAMLSASKGEK